MPFVKLSPWKSEPRPWVWPKAAGRGCGGPVPRMSRSNSSSNVKMSKAGGNSTSSTSSSSSKLKHEGSKERDHKKDKDHKGRGNKMPGHALRALVKKLHLNPNEKREKSTASARLAAEEAVTQVVEETATKYDASVKAQSERQAKSEDRPEKFTSSSKVHSEKAHKGLMRHLQATFKARQQITRLSFCGEGLFPNFPAGVCEDEIVEIFHSAELIQDLENHAKSLLADEMEDCIGNSEMTYEESGLTDGWTTPRTPPSGKDPLPQEDVLSHQQAISMGARNDLNDEDEVQDKTLSDRTDTRRGEEGHVPEMANEKGQAGIDNTKNKSVAAEESGHRNDASQNGEENSEEEARNRQITMPMDGEDSKGEGGVMIGCRCHDCSSCAAHFSGSEKEDGSRECTHLAVMAKAEELPVAVREVLDEAIHKLSQCSQRTEELQEGGCKQKALLGLMLKWQSELTQALDQKTAQVMDLMSELETREQGCAVIEEERRKFEALLAETLSKNQELEGLLSEKNGEARRMAAELEAKSLEKEEEIRRLHESLQKSRLEASSLKFLLTKRLKMDVQGLEAGGPLWGTFPGRSRSRQKDDWESHLNPLLDSHHQGRAHATDKKNEAPMPRNGSSQAHGIPMCRERSNGEDRKSSSSASSSSSSSSSSSEEELLGQGTNKDLDTKAQSQKTREEDRSFATFDTMDGELEGYEDRSMTAQEIAELQKLCLLECREAVDIRLENERLKEENDKLMAECDKTRRLLELSQLRTKGNVAFNRMEFHEAMEKYTQALELKVEDTQLNALLYCNRAAASSALGNHMDALADCIAAIGLDETCIRAYSRRADVFIAVWDYTGALNDLVTVLEKEGDCSQEVELKINAVKRRLKKHGSELDYYAILGIPSASTLSDIRSAYRKLALKYHPDKSGVEKEAVFKYISRAYRILSDPISRGRYDLTIASHTEKQMSRSRSSVYNTS